MLYPVDIRVFQCFVEILFIQRTKYFSNIYCFFVLLDIVWLTFCTCWSLGATKIGKIFSFNITRTSDSGSHIGFNTTQNGRFFIKKIVFINVSSICKCRKIAWWASCKI